MEFTLSDEQTELARTAQQFLSDNARGSYLREMVDEPGDASGPGFTEEFWSQLVDLGWVGLLAPESAGGAGMGMLEMMVILEEMGRLPLPGPFLSSAVLATRAADALGLSDLLVGLVDGSTRGTVALDESGHGNVVDRTRTLASRKSGQWRLTGTKTLVLDGVHADWVLVPARTQEGIHTFLIRNPGASAAANLDVTRRIGRLELDSTPAERVGPDGDHTGIWRRVADDGAIALGAESLGAMQQSFDDAVEYAKVRVQFGRPIATFQVIKHKAADMLEKIELCRVGLHYAAWASDTDDPVRSEATAMLKSFVGTASNEVTAEGIQIHGGVGFTWECDAHLHYRRAKANELLLGLSSTWKQRVADSYLGVA